MGTCIFASLDEIRLDILTTIFRSKDLEFPPRLVFNQSLKDFEKAKNFKLVFQEVNPAVPGKVIYEFQCISGLTHGHMREWASNITVNQLEGCRGSLMAVFLKFVLWVFPRIQPWHTPLENFILGNPMTISFSLRSDRYL